MSSPEVPPVPDSSEEGEDTPESAGEVIPVSPAPPSFNAEEFQRHAEEEEFAAFERDQTAREEVLARLRGGEGEHADEIIDAEFSDIENLDSLPVPYDSSVTQTIDEELVPRSEEITQDIPPQRPRRRLRSLPAEDQEQPVPIPEPEAAAEQIENAAENQEHIAEEVHPEGEHYEDHGIDHDHEAAHAEHADGHEADHHGNGGGHGHDAHGGHGHGKKLKPWQKKTLDALAVTAATAFSLFGIWEVFFVNLIKNLWTEGMAWFKKGTGGILSGGGGGGGKKAAPSSGGGHGGGH